MSHEDRRELIQRRLEEAFAPRYLNVIDESDAHRGHAGHQGGGRHFAVEISADVFTGKSSVESHRLIYGLFTDLMPDKIHALRIRVV